MTDQNPEMIIRLATAKFVYSNSFSKAVKSVLRCALKNIQARVETAEILSDYASDLIQRAEHSIKNGNGKTRAKDFLVELEDTKDFLDRYSAILSK